MQATVERPSVSSLKTYQNPYHAALVELATLEDSDAHRFIRHVLEVDATLIQVARVSFWFFVDDCSRIICEDLFAAERAFHESGTILEATSYPRYFRALREARVLSAEDARGDPRTSEFTEHYLIPNRITSMLDVAVRQHGRLVGIVCHEHCGARRRWTRDEEEFAASIADVIALALTTAERNRMQEALSRRERQLRLITQRVPAVLWTIDVSLSVTSASGAELQPLGLRPEILEGTSVVEWFEGAEPRARLLEIHERAIRGEHVSGVISRSGRELELHLEPFREEDGKIVGAIGLALDVTARREVERDRERLLREEQLARERADRERERTQFLASVTHALSASVDEAACADVVTSMAAPTLADWCYLVLIGPDGTSRVSGGPEALRDTIERAFRLDAPDGTAQAIRTRRPVLHPLVTPEMLRSTNGSWPIFASRSEALLEAFSRLGVRSYMAVPLLVNDRAIGALGLVRREATFEPGDLELAQELATRGAAALERARLHRTVVEAVRARDEFLSIAAHELYTPLTALELTLANIRRTLERTSAASNEHLDLAITQGRRLTRLVGQLLDVSRIQSGDLELSREEVELVSLTREVIASQPSSYQGHDVHISFGGDESLTGTWDRVRLEQVVGNLVGNAVKYGGGNEIEVVVRAEGPNREQAKIVVCDRGMGIPRERLGRVFERFERAVSSRQHTGLGLGLYIVKRIVEAHHGTIEIESAVGKGTKVTVRLPRAP